MKELKIKELLEEKTIQYEGLGVIQRSKSVPLVTSEKVQVSTEIQKRTPGH